MGQQKPPHRIGKANKKGSDQRALDRANPANHNHNECQNKHRFAHADLNRLGRADKGTGKPGQSRAKGKHNCIKAINIHSQGGDHSAISFTRTNTNAKAGFTNQQEQARRYGKTGNNDGKTEQRILEITGHHNSARQKLRNA